MDGKPTATLYDKYLRRAQLAFAARAQGKRLVLSQPDAQTQAFAALVAAGKARQGSHRDR